MGLIDDGQHVAVELGGLVVFSVGVFGISAASGVVGDTSLGVFQSYLAIIVGLYLMGYKRLPRRLTTIVGRYR